MSAGDTPLLAKTLTISGKDGDDAPRYLEKQVAQLLEELDAIRRNQP